MADLLIVDDDIDSAEVLAEIMRADGHDVRIAYDGNEGLRLAAERLPELALVDVEMPLLDGPGMAYQMFVEDMGMDEVPVVFLSGVPNLREVAARAGTPYFLSKPYRHRQLVDVVEHALAERVAPRPQARDAMVAQP